MTISSFFWRSHLTKARKQEIIDFYDTLTPEQKKMVDDIKSDAYREGVADGEGED